MRDDWQQTDQIVMSIQTAELRQAGITQEPSLNLSCSLVNIARGQCMLELGAGTSATPSDIGKLVIEIDRPVMRGKATIPQPLYDALLSRLASAPPRPISLCLSIATKLAVSLEGDLRIDEAKEVKVTDLSVTLPLK
tara:strand:- start:1 stop:411 length:411 start_codon:yes stop_codon:yes gene_type:complete